MGYLRKSKLSDLNYVCQNMRQMDRLEGLYQTGKDPEESLERAGMTCNKNGVANDPNPPTITSGIRLGSPAATTRGFKEEEFKFIGEKISTIINALSSSNADISMTESSILKDVTELFSNFPIYK